MRITANTAWNVNARGIEHLARSTARDRAAAKGWPVQVRTYGHPSRWRRFWASIGIVAASALCGLGFIAVLALAAGWVRLP